LSSYYWADSKVYKNILKFPLPYPCLWTLKVSGEEKTDYVYVINSVWSSVPEEDLSASRSTWSWQKTYKKHTYS
jgi:hypothetical protein